MKEPSRLLTYLVAILFFLLPPFLWLPVTVDPFNWPKNALLVGLALLLVLTWVVKLLASGQALTITKTPFSLPLLLLVAAYLISLFGAGFGSASLNQVEAAVLPMGVGTIAALVLIFLLLSGPLAQEGDRLVTVGALALTGGAILSGAVSLASYFVSFSFLPKPFVATGNLISLLPFLVIVLVGALAYGWFSLEEELKRPASLVGVAAGVLILGFLVFGNVWKVFSSLPSAFTFLPYPEGWQIATETIKVAPLWGRGPTNFLTAFALGRPLSLNSNPALWTFRFFVSSNTPFHLLATVGVVGFLAYLLLIFITLRTIFSRFSRLPVLGKSVALALGLSVVGQLFLPPTFVGWWFFLALLTLLAMILGDSQPKMEFFEEPPSRLRGLNLGRIAAVVLMVVFVPLAYFSARALAAEMVYKQAIDAVAANDGNGAYNKLGEAIGLNPFVEAYRLAYSQVNLAIANSLASKKDLNETDRTNITQLVQQAIREGKAAVAINQNKATNWENLTSIYRSLINFAQGADQWAVAAARQAAILNPTDPNPRLSLGGIYYSLGDYDSAINFFQQAVVLKPDWANAHYNLAVALREKKDLGNAITEMQAAISLVPPGSDDASRANGELKALQEAAEATRSAKPQPTAKPSPLPKATSPMTLEKPQPLPTPVIKPPLKLGTESGVPNPSPTP